MAGFDIKKFIEKLRRSWLLWAPLALVALLVINALGFLLPPRFQANATVRVFRSNVEGTNAVNDVLDPEDRLRTLKFEVTSFNFLSEIAGIVGIGTALHPNSTEYQQLILNMKKHVQISAPSGDTFTVSYEGDNADQTYAVVDNIVKLYQRNSQRGWEAKGKERVDYAMSQLAESNERLKQAQARIVEFTEQNKDTVPAAQDRHQRRIGELRAAQQTSLAAKQGAQDAITVLQTRRENLKENVETGRQRGPNPELAGAKKRKMELDLKLKSLRENFTEEHEQVRQAVQELTLIEDQIKELESGETDTVQYERNPALDLIEEAIQKANIDIANSNAALQRSTEEMAGLQKLIEQGPSVALELERLKNEGFLAERNVDAKTQALNQAQNIHSTAITGVGPTFDVVTPPLKPFTPSSPNRIKIFAVSVVFAAGLAMGLVLLLTLMDTAVRSVEEARGLLKMPVLGVVQKIVSLREEARLRRRRRIQFAGVAGMLLIFTTGVVLGVTVYREPLAAQLKHLQSMVQK